MMGVLGRHRKSEVAPLLSVAPTQPEHRVSRVKPVSWSQQNVVLESVAAVTSPPLTSSPAKNARTLNSFAHSVISLNRQQREHDTRSDSRDDSEGEDDTATERTRTGNQEEISRALPTANDPWGNVLGKVMRKTSFRGGPANNGSASPGSPASKRVSLTQMLKSREVKDLVKQAIVANHWTENVTRKRTVVTEPLGQRSSAMEHWMKTSMLRNTNPPSAFKGPGQDDDEYAASGIKSGFDVRDTPTGAMYGRALLLQESCRRAFAQSGKNRSQMDLQALKAWFQMTKLKITTDFERLQPAELDLLCRRMMLVHFHANEVVFRQGDEGDAMYIIFVGCVEVKVAQRILGEKVEVTVCELSKGDYFGERALLHDEPRAATIVAKSQCELVRITRKDYNIMLKQDQQEFLSRMQLAGTVNSHATLSTSVKPSLLLSRSRSTLHQQTQLEIISVLSKKKHTRSKPDVDMLSEYLQTLKFFRGLPKTFVRELCLVVDFLTLPASSYVFREGEVGDLFYIIFSGSVDIIVSSKDIRGNTQQTKLINLTEGSHFGELALMKGHGIRSAAVLTREETKFLVICEKDYNSTLRRMQKEDLAKRVAILDRIPMFQTPEWTGELLKEMSYVLSEQKLATGSVLFRQGEKAQQVYFVVRGELFVTKEIVGPFSKEVNDVFVERVGRDRVVGDDAAAGANFNEVIYREVTATAGTPVELLVLSKYDVFHRLSRAARETLRAAAHSHVESVVYLDRYHKTVKWDAFKQKLLSEHLNHDRMRKLLPKVAMRSKTKLSRRRLRQSSVSILPASLDHPYSSPQQINQEMTGSIQDRERNEAHSVTTTQSQLVDANEFLLLDPVDVATVRCFPTTERSIVHHVSSFNADAPPRVQSRERLLKSALATEQNRKVEILNEGNPLAYFDLEAIQAHQRRQQAEMRGRAASSRRLLLRRPDISPIVNYSSSSPTTGTTTPRNDVNPISASELTSRNVMNQFFQENFIFSSPEKPSKNRNKHGQRHRLLTQLEQRHSATSPGEQENESNTRNRRKTADVSADEHVLQIDVARNLAERLCHGDLVLVDVGKWDGNLEVATANASPPFRIRRCCESVASAKLITFESRRLGTITVADGEGRNTGFDETEAESSTFVVTRRKFALLPRATRPRVLEETQHRAVVGRFLRPSALVSSSGTPTDPMTIFASFQKVSTALSEQHGLLASQANVDNVDASSLARAKTDGLKMFASVSIVLSKRELETALCDDPFICIHALYPTEAEAMESALTTPPQALKNALLCILPVGEWLYIGEVYDWCVQIETDRRDKQSPPPSHTPMSSPLTSPTRRKAGSICGLPGVGAGPSAGPTHADWEIEKEKAHRLHQFICTRMGLHGKAHDKHQRSNGSTGLVSATGFTPRPVVSLEDKLATLQDYLDTTSQPPLGAKSSNPHTSILSKYRQMKRFGSIMRSRISAVTTPPLAGAQREVG